MVDGTATRSFRRPVAERSRTIRPRLGDDCPKVARLSLNYFLPSWPCTPSIAAIAAARAESISLSLPDIHNRPKAP